MGCLTRMLAFVLVAVIGIRLIALVPQGAVPPLDLARGMFGGEEERNATVSCLYASALEGDDRDLFGELLGDAIPAEGCTPVPSTAP